jgi:hypothetical protein
MTALRSRRRHKTAIGGFLAAVLMIVALAATMVGALTLRDSEEGETVGIDLRQVVAFPTTSNLALAVADDDGRLASLVVATLLPEGRGGSIVTVPVNADATIGLGSSRQPINSVFSVDDPEGFAATVESLLSITFERLEIVDAARLGELLSPLGSLDVDLPEVVIDSSSVGSGIVVDAGEQTLRRSVAVEAFTAIDDTGESYDHHPTTVELWSAVAANTPLASATTAVDGDELPAAGTEEFLERLWSGPVKVRDLDIDPGLAALAENPEDLDMVVIDRRDSLLVFTQVSPSLVSTPNEGLTFRLEVRYSDDQLAAAEDLFSSRSQVSRTLVGELLFFSSNVASVDPAPAAEGAPAVTRIEVSEERFVEELGEFAPLIFGESEVVVAPIVLDGVDAVVKVGTGYLEVQRRRSGDTVEGE